MPDKASIQIASVVIIGFIVGVGPGYFLADKKVFAEVPIEMAEMHSDAAEHREILETPHQEEGHSTEPLEGMKMAESEHHEEATTDSGGQH